MHHANVLFGSREWAFSVIPEEERTEGSDILFFEHDRLGIADAHTVIYESGLRPVSRAYRTFILIADTFLPDAQNALLKILEEPNDHSLFFLVLPSEDRVLPTLRSRLHVLGREQKVISEGILEDFLKLSYADRLSWIEEKLKKEEHVLIRAFVDELTQYARSREDLHLLKRMQMIEENIHTVGASKKMLLEHVALSIQSEFLL